MDSAIVTVSKEKIGKVLADHPESRILPSAAGPSESLQNSPTNAFIHNFTSTGASQSSTAWAEYLPTFMSADDFDGWDGSMLLPGFGRGQITLSGGLLHSQFGGTPGIM